MPDDSASYPRPGEVVAGKYRVERVLGAGGMGVVVAAHHLQLRTRVALKFMQPAASLDTVALARFLREARAAASIKSQHVARVSDIGTLENGIPYLVMEYLEGRDLDQELAERGRLPIPEAVDILLQACEALAEAHALGVVHRDLKPANLFLCRRGSGAPIVKLLDFGISKLMGAVDEPSVTQSQTLLGSPLYMSPEQLRSPRGVDARSDVWALGAVLYQLVTGGPPFPGELLSDVCVKIATEAPRPLLDLLPDAPPRLSAAVARCLEKDRKRRYPNMAQLALDLVELGSHRDSVTVKRLVSSIQAYPAPVVASALDLQDTIPRPRPGTAPVTAGSAAVELSEQRQPLLPVRPLAAVALVALAVLAGGGAWSFVRGSLGPGASPKGSATRAEPAAPVDKPFGSSPAAEVTVTSQPSLDRADSAASTPSSALKVGAGLPASSAAKPHGPVSAILKSSAPPGGVQSPRPASAGADAAQPRHVAPASSAAPRNVFDTRKL